MEQVIHQPTSPVSSRAWLRPIYFALGSISLLVAVVGIWLPLIPTTGPVLLAAFFFARSSSRVHGWLVGHKRFGKFISDFQAGRGIPLRAKVTAVVMMVIAFAFTLWRVDNTGARWGIVAVAVFAIWYVLHQPTTPSEA